MKKNNNGQAALEFLVTYGWAFLVILVLIGGLTYFGVGVFDFGNGDSINDYCVEVPVNYTFYNISDYSCNELYYSIEFDYPLKKAFEEHTYNNCSPNRLGGSSIEYWAIDELKNYFFTVCLEGVDGD